MIRCRKELGRFINFHQIRTISTAVKKSINCDTSDIRGTSTRSRLFIPTYANPHHIPLTLVDVHMRHEQLPFAYFFDETLDAALLESSLKNVLRWFPVLGGRIHKNRLSIECRVEDTVPLSFGEMDISLSDWIAEEGRDHIHRVGGHPILLPLFDSLFDSSQGRNKIGNGQNHGSIETTIVLKCKYENLVSIRVTYFKGGGTAIGVNFNHALGDTASCVRFVQCWGREMRRKSYPRGASNERANASCSGMITEEMVDLMGIGKSSVASGLFNMSDALPRFLVDFYEKTKNEYGEVSMSLQDEQGAAIEDEESQSLSKHEYVRLAYSSEVLEAMKAHGMVMCESNPSMFVSTNDMVTASGWLLKRALSRQSDWNISMVVNLRGRFGVEDFSNMDVYEEESVSGVFGNGITNVIANLHPTDSTFELADVSQAAISIRAALTAGLIDIPDRVMQSRMGMATSSNPGSTFSTTSWGQFPLWSIKFSENGGLAGFHGHPAHPLPKGRTFSSIIVSAPNGGCTYKLLLPSDQAHEARELHETMCKLYLEWHRNSKA